MIMIVVVYAFYCTGLRDRLLCDCVAILQFWIRLIARAERDARYFRVCVVSFKSLEKALVSLGFNEI